MASMDELAENSHTITWCPGCGNFSVLAALKKAIVDAGLRPHNTVIASGIGCNSKLPHFVHTYGFESIHGRELAAACGIKLANHTLNVIALGGDGDGYGIGLGHFIHACRRNYDMTYIVHDNQIYGLTTGQTSPTSEKGMKTKSTPEGVLEEPINPLALSISAGATFVARGFSGDLAHLADLIRQGIEHRGFAHIDVMQPCVVWNKVNTFEYFRKKCYRLGENKRHNPSDKIAAYKKALEWEDGIPIGVLYREKRETYEEGLPPLKKGPLAKMDVSDVDISGLLGEYG